MPEGRIVKRYEEIEKTARGGGYMLNPDREFCMMLVEGLLNNQDRYGIEACPCRLVCGGKEENRDIICPCVYRDDDLSEHGACFCALYINEKYDPDKQIPERRPAGRKQEDLRPAQNQFAYPVWRCSVCGYLCAKNHPPDKCPICKADGSRFERFA